MAVDSNSYGTVAQVEIFASEVVASRTFASGTQPTLSQVEQIIDLVADELNMHLTNSGYTVPVTVGDDPFTFRYLRAANSYGAAAEVLATYPDISYGGPEDSLAPTERRRHFRNQLMRAIAMIDNKTLHQEAMAESTLNDFKVGAEFDDDGKTKKATFTRSMWDNPNVGLPARVDE